MRSIRLSSSKLYYDGYTVNLGVNPEAGIVSHHFFNQPDHSATIRHGFGRRGPAWVDCDQASLPDESRPLFEVTAGSLEAVVSIHKQQVDRLRPACRSLCAVLPQ